MSYNHRSAEKAWLKWKEAEEKELRRQGMAEDAIQQLHTYEWQQFNRERQYLQRWREQPDELAAAISEEKPPYKYTVEHLLDEIENEQLSAFLSTVDPTTLKIIALWLRGYTSKQIASLTAIDDAAVRKRISRLKKKIKKFFEDVTK